MRNPMEARTTEELIKIAKEYGYCEKLRKNSHRIFACSGRATISIPDHKILAPGTRRNISKLILGESYYHH